MSVQRRPEPKPRRTKTTQSKAVPVQNHAGQKAASLFRPCRWVRKHQPVPKTPGKSGSAKPPPQDAQLKAALLKPPQDALSRTARKDTRPGKRHPANAPANTAPRNCSRKPRLTKPTLQNPPRIGAPHRSPRKKALQTVLRTENRGKIWRSAAKPLSSHIPNDACGRAIFPPQRPFIGKSNA